MITEKMFKNILPLPAYIFSTSLDECGQQTKEFISKILRRPSTATDDPKSALFLREKISVASAKGQRCL